MAAKKAAAAAATETKELKAAPKKKRAASKENKFYNEMKLEYMMKYIEDNAPNDKEWFKSVAIDSQGKYQHLIAKRAFCEKFMPDKLPTKKEKVNKSDLLKNW